MSDVVARLRAGGARRIVSIASLALLGGGLVWIAGTTQMGLGWRAFVMGFGALCLYGAWSVRQATGRDILLTRDGLFDETGRMLAAMDNIASVERGLFAMKPTSGFAVRLVDPVPFGWAPGVWWRFGRRLGVGGSVSSLEAKAMAEMLELVLADRAGVLRRD